MNGIQRTANQVIAHFKQGLSAEALSSLSPSDFDRLTVLIKDALSRDREEVADQLEALARKIKADIEEFDLSL
ncbi:hypothetical protein [Nitrosomonas sp. Is37]|uniref:hypothetical protein n=1 Tax=Nitrosomonas sp. Is37 TaxID=3080535 RepID=UPI00294AE458|nr:hypothetical protein [Nitrosomonas sp. Is37]MDV6343763.1 hypothetical protein [Nitrosomonas sp. Is37]